MDHRRNFIDLCDQRTRLLEQADQQLAAGNKAEYDSTMEKVSKLNEDITRTKNLIDEQERKMDLVQPSAAEARDAAEERGAKLMNGGAITFTASELRLGLRDIVRVDNSLTLASTSIATPSGVGSTIHDGVGTGVSALIDQVYVQDLTGLGSYAEAYVKSELTANGGTVAATAGKARAESEASFGVAQINPYEVSVTAYVDRNISRLTPAAYFDKVYTMAMRAMRRKVCQLIVNGDSEASPVMYGLGNAKNKAGENIFATVDGLAVNENMLDKLFFAYGGDEALGLGARVVLTKSQLKALGELRNANKERVFKIRPDAGNPSTGMIEDGGTMHPYTLVAGTGEKLYYGDPMNYLLGLFGDFTVRVDESIKGVERMHTILGDAMVGGNLIADKGFVVGTVAAG